MASSNHALSSAEIADLYMQSLQLSWDGGVSGGVSQSLNDVLDYLAKNPGARAKAVATGLGVSQRTAERWLKTLRDNGQIEFMGAPKTGGYYLKSGAGHL